MSTAGQHDLMDTEVLAKVQECSLMEVIRYVNNPSTLVQVLASRRLERNK